MNRDFQQYATSAAFVLSLSRPMISLLALIEQRTKTEEHPAMEHLNAYYALRRRGLVENRNGEHGRRVYATEEGKLVLELCRRAGLVATKLRRVA